MHITKSNEIQSKVLNYEDQIEKLKNKLQCMYEEKMNLKGELEAKELEYQKERIQFSMKSKSFQLDTTNQQLQSQQLEEFQKTLNEQNQLIESLIKRAENAEKKTLEALEQKEHKASVAQSTEAYQDPLNPTIKNKHESEMNQTEQLSSNLSNLDQPTLPDHTICTSYQVIEFKKELIEYKKQVNHLTIQVKSKNVKIEELEIALTDLQQLLTKFQEDYDCLEQLEHMHNLNEEAFEEKLNKVYADLELSIVDRKALEKQIVTKTNEIEIMESEYKAIVLEIERLQHQVDNLSKEAKMNSSTKANKKDNELLTVKTLLEELKIKEDQTKIILHRLEAGYDTRDLLDSILKKRCKSETCLINKLNGIKKDLRKDYQKKKEEGLKKCISAIQPINPTHKENLLVNKKNKGDTEK